MSVRAASTLVAVLVSVAALACRETTIDAHDPRLIAAQFPQVVDNLQQQQLVASDAAVNDAYGFSIAVKGDRLAVGALGVANFAGAVYTYQWNAATLKWENEAKLVASDAVADLLFGQSVAMTDTYLVVGTGSSAPVRVFTHLAKGWGNERKIASPGDGGDLFGGAVALDGNTLLIGANTDSSGIGAAYVFTLVGDSWMKQATLVASDAAIGDYFGTSVALSGDTAIIGAFGDDSASANDAGAAYVFVRNGSKWSEQQKLVAKVVAQGANAGESVSIEADTAVVGAPNDDFSKGAAYVWTRDGEAWTERKKLVGITDGEQLGFATAIQGDVLVVSASNYDDVRGAVRVFQGAGETWVKSAELAGADATSDAEFGRSVSLSGVALAIGAPQASAFKGGIYTYAGVQGGPSSGAGGAPSTDGVEGGGNSAGGDRVADAGGNADHSLGPAVGGDHAADTQGRAGARDADAPGGSGFAATPAATDHDASDGGCRASRGAASNLPWLAVAACIAALRRRRASRARLPPDTPRRQTA